MSAATTRLREWAEEDRTQAAAIRYMAALGDDDARASLSVAQAESLEATADGWDQIADAAGE